MYIKQLSVFVENTHGRLAEITKTIAKAGIDIRALSISDTTDFGILRLVVDKPYEAEKTLKDAGLTASFQGNGTTVTAQLPGADTALEQGSGVLLYLGEPVPQSVTIPDFSGMTAMDAELAAQNAGVTLRQQGNPDPNARVQHQDLPPGTAAEPGSTVTITFTDPSAHD